MSDDTGIQFEILDPSTLVERLASQGVAETESTYPQNDVAAGVVTGTDKSAESEARATSPLEDNDVSQKFSAGLEVGTVFVEMDGEREILIASEEASSIGGAAMMSFDRADVLDTKCIDMGELAYEPLIHPEVGAEVDVWKVYTSTNGVVSSELAILANGAVAVVDSKKDAHTEEYLASLKAQYAREQDIRSHIADIVESVELELQATIPFTPKDIDIGVGALGANIVRERTHSLDSSGVNHPKALIDEEKIRTERAGNTTTKGGTYVEISDKIVDFTLSARGVEAGSTFAHALLRAEFPFPENVRQQFVKNLELHTEKPKKGGFFARQLSHDEIIDTMSNEQVWGALRDAYICVARALAARSHIDIFSSLKLPEYATIAQEHASRRNGKNRQDVSVNIEAMLERKMLEDLKTLARLVEWTEDRDFEIMQEGVGVGYIKAPIKKHPSHVDAIDKIIPFAGGNMISVGSNSFMSLVDAKEDQSKGIEGAFLVFAYGPQMPVHAMEKTYTRINLDGEVEAVPMDQAVPQPADIRWKVRVWHLTDTGHSLMMKRLDALQKNPKAVFTPFVNPRNTLEEIYPLIVALFEVRSQTAQHQHTIRNLIERHMQNRITTTTSGQQMMDLGLLGTLLKVAEKIKLPESATVQGVEEIINTLYEDLGENERLIADAMAEIAGIDKSFDVLALNS